MSSPHGWTHKKYSDMSPVRLGRGVDYFDQSDRLGCRSVMIPKLRKSLSAKVSGRVTQTIDPVGVLGAEDHRNDRNR